METLILITVTIPYIQSNFVIHFIGVKYLLILPWVVSSSILFICLYLCIPLPFSDPITIPDVLRSRNLNVF